MIWDTYFFLIFQDILLDTCYGKVCLPDFRDYAIGTMGNDFY